MKSFTILWLGQLLSMLGSAMTRFVLAIWLWQQTNQVTALVLVGVVSGVTSFAANLIGGPVVDRFSRKRVMILADLITGLGTVFLLVMAAFGRLAPWHIYLAAGVSGLFQNFQGLAFSASITLIVPKAQYTRANSMLAVAEYAAGIGAPAPAGLIMGPIGITGVMLFDVITFLFAIGTVSAIAIPQVREPIDAERSAWQDILFGFRYIFSRPSLSGLMALIFSFNLIESFGYPLIVPMILARTGGDQVALGIVQSVLGVGGLAGGLVLTVWGGFKKKIAGVIVGLLLTGLLGDVVMGLGTGLPVWIAAAVFIEVFIPLAFSSNNAIWQIKIAPGQQGRVFAARRVISGLGEPVALLATGLLADKLFEPAMQPGGWLAPVFGWVIPTGPGAGMGVLLVLCGFLSALASAAAYAFRPVREIESILPDYGSDGV